MKKTRNKMTGTANNMRSGDARLLCIKEKAKFHFGDNQLVTKNQIRSAKHHKAVNGRRENRKERETMKNLLRHGNKTITSVPEKEKKILWSSGH